MPPHDPEHRLKYVTQEEASNIALAAAKEAVRETLAETFGMLGVNVADFEAMQKFRDDLEWARHARELSERTGHRAWTAIVTVVASGLTIGIWEYVRTMIGKH